MDEEKKFDGSKFPHRGAGGFIPHIESLIFASDKPLTSLEITDLINAAFGFMEEKIFVEQIDASLEGIVEKYNSEFYPFEVKQSGGGWQFLTKKEFHKTVAQLNGEKFLKRLSNAALETLAIVAYKQPVTKGEIESIRGVSTDYAMQKLLEKELVIITGRNEKLPGHPLVYATSKTFMDYFGINSSEDLPKIKEVLADQLVQPTIVNHTDFEQSEVLAVTDDGALIVADDVNGFNERNMAAGEAAYTAEGLTINRAESDVPSEESNTETIEDEIAEEEFISDEIFAAEDEAIEENSLKDLLDETANDNTSDDETNPATDDDTKE